MQKVSDEPLTVCEKCGGRLEKQWSLSGFQFKGEGWYITDYSKRSGGSAEGGGPAEKTSATESTATGDSASKETTTTPKPDSAAAKD
jgi:predicted nucleic acid-binding Zn ribbon protein